MVVIQWNLLVNLSRTLMVDVVGSGQYPTYTHTHHTHIYKHILTHKFKETGLQCCIKECVLKRTLSLGLSKWKNKVVISKVGKTEGRPCFGLK